MQPVQFGKAGIYVSPLALGTMMFGSHADLKTSREIAHHALDQGVFFWDTADMYGAGASEEVCGKLLQGCREEVVLATKVYATMSQRPNDRGLSAKHILQACDASLRRLQTDYIDIYYLHLPDRLVPIEESLRAMEDLLRSGRVRYIACSNYRAWEVVELIHTARAHGWQPISAIQPLYNLVNRDIEVEMLPMAHHMGLGVTTYSPLARGVLTGKYGGGAIPVGSRLARQDRRFLQAEWRQDSVHIAEQLRPTAQRLGCSLGQLAIAWAMQNRYVHSVIVGPKNAAQARESLAAAAVKLDPEVEKTVDRLVPPGCHSGKEFFDVHYSPVTGRICPPAG